MNNLKTGDTFEFAMASWGRALVWHHNTPVHCVVLKANITRDNDYNYTPTKQCTECKVIIGFSIISLEIPISYHQILVGNKKITIGPSNLKSYYLKCTQHE